MSSDAPATLIVSGVVHMQKPLAPGVGDVHIYPAAPRNNYIDGSIWDGRKYRRLDLQSFGVDTACGGAADYGHVMRQIASMLNRRARVPVHYASAGEAGRHRYVFYGVPPPRY